MKNKKRGSAFKPKNIKMVTKKSDKTKMSNRK